MSCFIVDNADIDVIINAAAQYDLLDGADPRTLGATLLAENIASYRWRYEHVLEPADQADLAAMHYTLTATEAPLHPLAVLRALACYSYQSCEHPGWVTSAAFAVCESLTAKAESLLPAYLLEWVNTGWGWRSRRYQVCDLYDRMPWDFTDVRDAAEHRWAAAA